MTLSTVPTLPMSLWKSLSDIAGGVLSGGRGLMSSVWTGAGQTPQTSETRRAQTGVAFTIAVIALSAKMAKADGVVLGVEKAAFHRVFEVSEVDAASVERLFLLAQQDIAGYTAYADRIANELSHDPALLADVLDSLFHIATADRAMHPGEDEFLAEVARRFGFSEVAYRHRRSRFVLDPDNPYDVLGLDAGVSDPDLKARHRKLVRENHPDIFIGRGLPPETVALATRRLAAINAAYAAIAKERGL